MNGAKPLTASLAALVLAGCAARPARPGGAARTPNLVMATAALHEDQGSAAVADAWRWENVRNATGSAPSPGIIPDYQPPLFSRRIHRERLRITNGRPREQSTFHTLSVADEVR